ncbi:Hypothetical protein CINCED_3A012439 [Cinara cedri]|uniref:Protein white n=1 Tax=Cinara cedri TaxID=506608 RepID=A0A5E4MRN1_9HEMI|nr:Hypothetical protein CINCED_3A012439 [Cinara cedri]
MSGSARPGELLALMGSSGAGKTTLLNSLTFRSDRTVTETGVRTINGVPVNRKLLTAISAYVQQHELFIGTLTIWEHLVFQALVRMDRHIPYEKRIARVEQVIKDLSLEKCKNSIIGVTGELKGLSGGEMKRLSFASEVLTDPPLIFCDEPTSGLDSFMAHNVIGMLKNMASNGKTIICTIHQPSSEIYYMFDRIMLMASGRTAFFGVPNEAITFFKTLGVGCPKNHNPADFFVQLLAIVPSQELRSCKTIDTVCEEYECSLYKYSEIIYQKKLFSSKKLSWSRLHLDGLQNISSPYKASWTEQLSAVLWRSWLSVKKEPALVRIRLAETIIVALMMSFFFYDQHLDQDGVISINGAIYLCITVMTYQNMWSVINVFCSELPVFLREHHNGMYRTDVYFLSKTLAEVPLFLIIPVLFTSILYYAVGLNPKFIHFIIAIILISLVSQVAVSVGYLVSCASVNLRVALFMSAVTYMPFMLCGGFFLNIESIPSYFRWLSIFSWYKYANEGLQINQWSDIESIQCSSLNTTCLRTGDDVLKSNSFVYSNIITDIISLLLLIVGFRFLAFLSLLVKTSRN